MAAELISGRRARMTRTTSESDVYVEMDLDGTGRAEISTTVPFYDHMLTALSRHSQIDLTVRATGDTHIDVHHTVEDVAITLGEVLKTALGDKSGIRRFGEASVPLDEALARAVVDVSGRPYLVHEVRPAGDVDDGARQRLVQRHGRLAEAADAGLVPERGLEHLAQGDGDVLDRVVHVDVRVPGGTDRQVDLGVPGQRGEHVVVERHGGGDLSAAGAVQIHLDVHVRLARGARHARTASGDQLGCHGSSSGWVRTGPGRVRGDAGARGRCRRAGAPRALSLS